MTFVVMVAATGGPCPTDSVRELGTPRNLDQQGELTAAEKLLGVDRDAIALALDSRRQGQHSEQIVPLTARELLEHRILGRGYFDSLAITDHDPLSALRLLPRKRIVLQDVPTNRRSSEQAWELPRNRHMLEAC